MELAKAYGRSADASDDLRFALESTLTRSRGTPIESRIESESVDLMQLARDPKMEHMSAEAVNENKPESENKPPCVVCQKPGFSKCSQCKTVWYCGKVTL